MTQPKYLTHADAQKNGWFSRRHETPDANREARTNYNLTRGKKARQERAQERNSE